MSWPSRPVSLAMAAHEVTCVDAIGAAHGHAVGFTAAAHGVASGWGERVIAPVGHAQGVVSGLG